MKSLPYRPNPRAKHSPNTHRVYRFMDYQMTTRKGRAEALPIRIVTRVGAQVALQRCPILCTGIVSIMKNGGSFNYVSGVGWLIQTMLGNWAGAGCPWTKRSG